jgi:FMN phosphatase YigB (HAD superfamily)
LIKSLEYDPIIAIASKLESQCSDSKALIKLLLEREWANISEAVDTLPRLVRGIDRVILDGELHRLVEEERKHLKLSYRAEQYFRLLSRATIKLVIASNLWSFSWPYIRPLLADCDCDIEFFLSFREGISKPSHLFYRTLIERIGKPKIGFMVGDSFENDIKPALRSGLKAIQITNNRDFMAESPYHFYMANNLYEAAETILNLINKSLLLL